MFNTKQYDFRGFHILGDALQRYAPLDAICQFEYKNHQISISTAGMSKGACQQEVFIFDGEKRDVELKRTHTVQEAIEYIDSLNQPSLLECQIVETPDIHDTTDAHAALHTKITQLVKAGWAIAGYTNDDKKYCIWVRAKDKEGK